MGKNQSNRFQIDFVLICILLALATFSVIAISGAQPSLPEKLQGINFASKQAFWFVCGSIMIVIMMVIDYDRYKQIVWYLYGFGMLLLLGLELNVPGALEANGAVAWYELPVLGNFQPSEPMKIVMILLIAKIISEHNEQRPIRTLKDDFWLISKVAMVVLPPLLLIARQPDLGHVMVISAITATMLMVSGIRWRIIIIALLSFIGLIALAVFVYFAFPEFIAANIKSYQLDRFYGWLAPYEYPTQGFQLIYSLLAIGSGQLVGKGYLEG
ncbi:MAG: FtsW/RodA/SpoVE family cell cycle protein, partial [Bacillaceae bacterium]